jgi:hypothetical protein
VDQEHDGQCKNHGAPNGVAPGAKIGSFGFAMPTEQTIAQDNYPEPDTMPPSHGSYHHNAASHKNPSKRNYDHNESPKNENARYHEDHPTNKITCNCNQPTNDSAKNRHQDKPSNNKQSIPSKSSCNSSAKCTTKDHPTNKTTSKCNQPNSDSTKHRNEPSDNKQSIPSKSASNSSAKCTIKDHPTNKTTSKCNQPNNDSTKNRGKNEPSDNKQFILNKSFCNSSAKSSKCNIESTTNENPNKFFYSIITIPPTNPLPNETRRTMLPTSPSRSCSRKVSTTALPSTTKNLPSYNSNKPPQANHNKDISKHKLLYSYRASHPSGSVQTIIIPWPNYKPATSLQGRHQ